MNVIHPPLANRLVISTDFMFTPILLVIRLPSITIGQADGPKISLLHNANPFWSYGWPHITTMCSTTILVIPQEVPYDYIRSTVTMNPSEYLNVITQEIMSRTRLEKIINELSLFPKTINNHPMEEILEAMRKNIDKLLVSA